MPQVTKVWVERKIPGPEQYGNRTIGAEIVLEDGDVPSEIFERAWQMVNYYGSIEKEREEKSLVEPEMSHLKCNISGKDWESQQ